MKYRYEDFGGIVAGEDPPFLAFVDQDYMRGLGLPNSPLWTSPNPEVGILSAPLEAHIALTNRCSAGCPHCYMDATRQDPGELDTENFKQALQVLADMKVFHVALGGGEALERPDLFEIAAFARRIGLVPNLTLSGRGVTADIAGQMSDFGQVNISMDGVGPLYPVFRGKNLFEEANQAIRHLIAAQVPTGINCVLGRQNFHGLETLFAYARDAGANEIEILRYKPAGRATLSCEEEACTFEQNIELVPLLGKLSQKYGVPAKIDCSFIPMLCWHDPDMAILEKLSTYGCEAGNVLLGIRSNGQVAGCSFLSGSGLSVFDLAQGLKSDVHIQQLVSQTSRAQEPCQSCPFLALCKGGCRAVSLALAGDPDAPDPHCPRVVEWQKKREPAK